MDHGVREENMKIKADYEIKSSDLANLIVSALEGGSNEWMHHFRLKYTSLADIGTNIWYAEPRLWADEKFIVSVSHENCEAEEVANVDRDYPSLVAAMQLFADKYPKHFSDFVQDNADAETADVFMQIWILGEVIFG